MREILDKLIPVPDNIRNIGVGKSANIMANNILFPTQDISESVQVLILGVKSDSTDNTPNNVRLKLYSLYNHNPNTIITDLGDILLDDIDVLKSDLFYKYFTIIISKEKNPINIFIDHYLKSTNTLSVSCISPSIVFNDYLSEIFSYKDRGLFNFNILGYQKYMSDPQNIDQMSDNYFQTIRLGELRNNIRISEPILRDSHLLYVDLMSIRNSDSNQQGPNGLYAEEVCQLVRYSGLSDKLRIAVIFGNQNSDNEMLNDLESHIIWHLIEGFANRAHENMLNNVNGIKKIVVNSDNISGALVFYHSGISGRWWMEIKRHNDIYPYIVACSEDDYKVACNHEVPTRWVWYHQKLSKKN